MSESRNTAVTLGSRLSDRISRLWWTLLLRGVAAILFGFMALLWPGMTLILLVSLVGAYLVLDGVMSLLLAMQSGDYRGSLLNGVVGVIGGCAVMFWPELTASLMLVILGVWAIVQGFGLYLTGRALQAEDAGGGLFQAVGAFLLVFGIVALIWRGVGAVAISWLIALTALALGALLILVALRIKNIRDRLRSARH